MFLTPSDLEPFATIDEVKASAMIEDAEAMAAQVAPCIVDTAFLADALLVTAVRAVLRQAVLRWNDAGSGATQTQIAGPFSQTTQYQARRGMFWPSEIEQLQELCRSFRGETDAEAGGVSMIAEEQWSQMDPALRFQYAWPAPSRDLSTGWW